MRTHPETGKKNLFVNPGFTTRIVGLTRQEYLVWDNRTTMHYAVSDYGEEHRVIQRVIRQGNKPFYVCDPAGRPAPADLSG